MNGLESILLPVIAILLLMLVLGWRLYAIAVRVDRLHRQVLGARATLEKHLAYRAQAAVDLGSTGLLDAASAMLLQRAAHEALDCEHPIVPDGLDPLDTSGRRAAPAAGAPGRSRAAVESDLSRVIRAAVDAEARAELRGTELGTEAVDRLERAGARVVLARRFHNTHVAEARRLRSTPAVRLLRLAGCAPMPSAFDIDDDIEPSPDQEAS
ncbi:hypothetical protein CHIBA101_1365 [Actinomyces sp. Chiba101]|uniref:hypothetical protein n=1 Tax=Actinomyces TaxID=1654 RepID=UPI000974E52D|nr:MULTISPECIES: hypothetical protein [Actinomyces]BAW93223.1 hypothetical protein CHIBA101_1365 [Actinomyces sp. Chiba101]GAV95541.1 hypothetical protein ADENT20671_2340 [Actinomyces denticolens]SUU04269.1 Uncharacterised protein [Actinomyces denticolens]